MEASEIESAIQAHGARNRELLELIASKGADPNVPRDIDLHFWASNENAARKLSAALEARGYSPVAMKRAVADASLWNVETNAHAAPLVVAAPAFVEDLVRLAAANDAEFDGWGTSI
jgi:regulator of RNase E activity RraB